MTMTEGWIKTPRGNLFLREWAGDPDMPDMPLILMHDSLGSVDLWRDFPVALAKATGRRVIAYDRLGFGRSDPHPGRLDPLSFITSEARGDFMHLLDGLGIGDFAVLGHSVGGGMGLGIAAALPDRCRALVTIAAQTFAEPLTLSGIRDARRDFMRPGGLDGLARYHGVKADWVLSAWTETWLAPEFATWSLDETLTRLRCPVLVIHGDADGYGSPAHPERIVALANGPVTLRLLPGEGHFPHRSDPAGTLAAIAAFLLTT
ncbi:alpha/beta hydrolase [Paracoccus sp. M683]|uniref:alpha/beta fold hydrolase n=1 Tax=Paracoccus sp. M683 TaxID=2594268 RepID=UPI00117D66BD|nr:alpha/beta hydrolase [Paracoccus sp. M683]TRW98392.1 alpha/beta hydrolase [Paracoccus sp. M683]